MASVQTTQTVWKKIVLRAKKLDSNLYHSLPDDPSHYKGDRHPVESVSFDEIQLWLQAANRLLEIKDPEALLIFKDVGSDEILRLPTQAEWDMISMAITIDTPLSQVANIRQIAWLAPNSGNHHHPVGEKDPIEFQGQKYYDYTGNVWTFVSDWAENHRQSGVDPVGPDHGTHHVSTGGAFDTPIMRAPVPWIRVAWLQREEKSPLTGFRLAKSKK